jgi:hypothetical protein
MRPHQESQWHNAEIHLLIPHFNDAAASRSCRIEPRKTSHSPKTHFNNAAVSWNDWVQAIRITGQSDAFHPCGRIDEARDGMRTSHP